MRGLVDAQIARHCMHGSRGGGLGKLSGMVLRGIAVHARPGPLTHATSVAARWTDVCFGHRCIARRELSRGVPKRRASIRRVRNDLTGWRLRVN